MKMVRFLALIAVIAGVVGWVITFSVNPYSSPYAASWQITWIANPLGAILSTLLLIKKAKHGLLLLVLNLVLIMSFGPIWFLTELFNMLKQT